MAFSVRVVGGGGRAVRDSETRKVTRRPATSSGQPNPRRAIGLLASRECWVNLACWSPRPCVGVVLADDGQLAGQGNVRGAFGILDEHLKEVATG